MLVALSAARRHSRSAVPPAGKGTTIVTGWLGNPVCACPTSGQPAVRIPTRTAPTVLLRWRHILQRSILLLFCAIFIPLCHQKSRAGRRGHQLFTSGAKPVERF